MIIRLNSKMLLIAMEYMEEIGETISRHSEKNRFAIEKGPDKNTSVRDDVSIMFLIV